MDLTTLQVNDRVAITRSGSWDAHSEGIYIVKKVNKTRITLGRESDGYERTFTFSMRTGMGSGATERYCSPFIESVADKEARDARNAARRTLNTAWERIEESAKHKNINTLREAVAALEELLK